MMRQGPKLNERQAVLIRRLTQNDLTRNIDISRRFNISTGHVSNIKAERRWKDAHPGPGMCPRTEHFFQGNPSRCLICGAIRTTPKLGSSLFARNGG